MHIIIKAMTSTRMKILPNLHWGSGNTPLRNNIEWKESETVFIPFLCSISR